MRTASPSQSCTNDLGPRPSDVNLRAVTSVAQDVADVTQTSPHPTDVKIRAVTKVTKRGSPGTLRIRKEPLYPSESLIASGAVNPPGPYHPEAYDYWVPGTQLMCLPKPSQYPAPPLSDPTVKKLWRRNSTAPELVRAIEGRETPWELLKILPHKFEPLGVRVASHCWYVPVRINEGADYMYMLLDTGSAVTVMQLGAYKSVARRLKTPLFPCSTPLASVTGDRLTVHGFAVMLLNVGGLLLPTRVVVADIDAMAIIGMNFLTDHCCSVELTDGYLVFPAGRVVLSKREHVRSCRVRVESNLTLAPYCECIVPVTVESPEKVGTPVGQMETWSDYRAKRDLVVAYAVVPATSATSLLVLNPTGAPVDLRKDRVIAKLEAAVYCANGDYAGRGASVRPDRPTSADCDLLTATLGGVKRVLIHWGVRLGRCPGQQS